MLYFDFEQMDMRKELKDGKVLKHFEFLYSWLKTHGMLKEQTDSSYVGSMRSDDILTNTDKLIINQCRDEYLDQLDKKLRKDSLKKAFLA